jgi:hypothetical protein
LRSMVNSSFPDNTRNALLAAINYPKTLSSP